MKNIPDWITHILGKSPQKMWASLEDPAIMLELLPHAFPKAERNTYIKCLVDIVKPCLAQAQNFENRPSMLMETIENYLQMKATQEQVKLATDTCFLALSDPIASPVWMLGCLTTGTINDCATIVSFVAETVADATAFKKSSCEIIRKHFPNVMELLT